MKSLITDCLKPDNLIWKPTRQQHVNTTAGLLPHQGTAENRVLYANISGKSTSGLPQLSKASCALDCIELADIGLFVERYTPILCAQSHHFSHQTSLIAGTKYIYFFKNLWLICPKGQGRPILGAACGRASYLLSNTKRPLSGAGWPTWGHWRSQSWKIITSEGRGSRCGKHVLFKAFGCPVGTGW